MSNYARTLELLEQLKSSKQNLAVTLTDKGEDSSYSEPFDTLVEKAGNYVPKTMIFVDDSGNEIVGTVVAQETIFDATVDDVREGKVFASATGVKTGEKEIPGYLAHEGILIIRPGYKFEIQLPKNDQYDYTLLHCMICDFNSSLSKSVATQKVVIGDNVYAVQSTTPIYNVTKIHDTYSIDLGFTNDTGEFQILRYFTYKEIN